MGHRADTNEVKLTRLPSPPSLAKTGAPQHSSTHYAAKLPLHSLGLLLQLLLVGHACQRGYRLPHLLRGNLLTTLPLVAFSLVRILILLVVFLHINLLLLLLPLLLSCVIVRLLVDSVGGWCDAQGLTLEGEALQLLQSRQARMCTRKHFQIRELKHTNEDMHVSKACSGAYV